MKRVIFLAVLLVFVASGCKYFSKDKKKDDTTAIDLQKAKEDSINNARDAEEQQRLAREQAEADAQRELDARFRFHVIIGSFKIPSNASSWLSEVQGMGFKEAKVVEAPNGFSLVSVGGFETYSKAFNEINRINADQQEPWELWVYEKR